MLPTHDVMRAAHSTAALANGLVKSPDKDKRDIAEIAFVDGVLRQPCAMIPFHKKNFLNHLLHSARCFPT
jgi:hypothetical protein